MLFHQGTPVVKTDAGFLIKYPNGEIQPITRGVVKNDRGHSFMIYGLKLVSLDYFAPIK